MDVTAQQAELYEEKALTVLREKGFRLTRPRRLVIDLLARSEKALSAYEIKDILDQSGEQVDTVSIYRIIDCLHENHLVHRVLTTGKVMKCRLESEDACERDQHDHCHHLLICEKCGSVEEVHCPGVRYLVDAMETESGFRIHRHYLEFAGICTRCR